MVKLKVELTIPSDLKNEPIVYMMSRDFKVVPNIVEASFSTSMGWVILILEGGQEEIDRLLAFLKAKNVQVKIVGK